MRELFDKIRNDKGLQELLTKAISTKANGSNIILLERKETKWGASVQLVNYYSNREDYEKSFTDAVRARCSNRLMAYNGTGSYECLTDIVDNSGDKKIGHWVVMGYGVQDPQTKERPFVLQEFKNPDELNAEKKKYFDQIDQLAVVHQYGTTDYTMVKTVMLSGDAKPELIISDIDQDLEEIRKAAGTWERKLKETEGPISDVGPALNL